MYCSNVNIYESEGSLAVGTFVYNGDNEFSVLIKIVGGCSVLTEEIVVDIGMSKAEAYFASGWGAEGIDNWLSRFWYKKLVESFSSPLVVPREMLPSCQL